MCRTRCFEYPSGLVLCISSLHVRDSASAMTVKAAISQNASVSHVILMRVVLSEELHRLVLSIAGRRSSTSREFEWRSGPGSPCGRPREELLQTVICIARRSILDLHRLRSNCRVLSRALLCLELSCLYGRVIFVSLSFQDQ